MLKLEKLDDGGLAYFGGAFKVALFVHQVASSFLAC